MMASVPAGASIHAHEPRQSGGSAGRRFVVRWLLCAALLGAALVGACRSDGDAGVRIESLTPTSTPAAVGFGQAEVRVAASGGLHDLVDHAVGRVSDPPRLVLSRAAQDAAADVRVVATGPGGADPVLRRWSVASAAKRIDLNDVSSAAVQQAAREGRLFAAAEDAPLVAGFYAEHGQVVAVPAEELAAWLASIPEALALVPVDTVTVRVRALMLDGVNPATGEGDLSGYPLVTRGRVEVVVPSPAADEAAIRVAIALDAPEPPVVWVTFTGDLIPARCVYDEMRRRGDWTAPYEVVGDRLRGADITVGSLDAAISDQGTPIGCRETFSLLAPVAVTEGFARAGFDVITVASNHVKDCGASGPCGDTTFLDTLAALRAVGVEPVGGGPTLTEARQPAVITVQGVRFAFLGYDDIASYYHAGPSAAGTAPLDEAMLAEDIQAARMVADVVVVLPQWGEEYTPHPTERQRRLAATAVEAGATLVVGNHPHVVQAAAPLGESYVAYALGNFLFDQDWSRETTESVLLEATFRGSRLVAVRFVPLQVQERVRPVFLEGEAAAAVLRRMMEAAERLPE